jgi:hypothetical protein|tara:strand:+ start:1235 stop:1702 length:468 start_codon:yes stop_codon:yes gene_type:complete
MIPKRYFLRFILNIYPPLFFNRIILKKISKDYREMTVVLKKSIFNINFHKTIFGGSIFSACDPYFPTMYYNIFEQKQKKLIIWVKDAEIKYINPANSTLRLSFKIQDTQINEVENALALNGKHEITNKVSAINREGIVCAQAEITIYLRDPNFIN